METVAGAVLSALPSRGSCQPTPAPTPRNGSSGGQLPGALAGSMQPMNRRKQEEEEKASCAGPHDPPSRVDPSGLVENRATWVDAHAGVINPLKWARLMHAQNGNIRTSNRYAVLSGLVGEDAMDLAEEIAAEDDVCGGSCAGSESGESCDSVLVREIPDEAVYEGLDVIGRVFVKAFRRFNVGGDPRSAELWNDAHRMVDSSKTERHLPLHRGPRFVTVNQPGKEAKATKGTKKKKSATRSPAMKVRDAARVSAWLSKMDPQVAEGWVRANKPAPNQVPASTAYMGAYGEGRTRGEYYGDVGTDDAVGSIDQFLYDGITGSTEYLGPRTRALIQTLLAIGNIEMNPGPVQGLEGANYGHDGTDVELAFAAGVRFLLSKGIAEDTALLSGNVQLSPGVFPVNARKHVAAHDVAKSGSHVTLGHAGGDYVVTLAWNDAQGNCFGGNYERVWAGGQWTTEFTGPDGVLVVFPDLDGLSQTHGLIGKLTTRGADGKSDIKTPAVLIYENVKPAVPRRVVERRATVVAGGLEIHYYRGCNVVAVCCPSIHGCVGMVPTPRWGECEKLYASGHSRQVAANNVTQVLRTCDELPGNMLGVVQLAISEAMLPSAMVVASVASTHRDAAINRARLGKGPRSVWDIAINGSQSSPDYGAMTHSSADAPWHVVWAARGCLALGAGVGIWLGYKYASTTISPYVTEAYCKLREEALRFAKDAQLHGYRAEEVAGQGMGYEAYLNGAYSLSDQYIDAHINSRAVGSYGQRLSGWLRSAFRLSGSTPAVGSTSNPYLSWSNASYELEAEALLRTQLTVVETSTRLVERMDWVRGQVNGEHMLSYVFGQVCGLTRQALELTQTVRDYLSGEPVMRISQGSACVFVAYVVGGAPTWEEIAKRRSRVFYYGIPLLETAKLMASGWTPIAALSNRFFLHCGFAALPLWAGILVHGLHNLACFAAHGTIQVGDTPLVYAILPVVSLVALKGVEYVVENGERWWSTSPMGQGSQFDELFGSEHVAEPDPLLRAMVAARKPRYGKRSRNEVFQLFPSVIDMASYANERGNYVHSMHGRVGKKTPTITDDVGFTAIRAVLQSLSQSVRARKGIVEPLDFDEFVSKFGPGKQQAYREARALFDVVGTGPIMHPKRYKDFRADECAAFLKHELNVERPDVISVFGGKRYQYAPGDPRTICPRWLPFQSVMIPYILAMEANVKEELRTRSPELFGVEVRFASGLSIEQMSAMCRELMSESGLDCIIDNGDDGMFTVNGVAFYVDGQRWDAHFRREYHHEIIDSYSVMGLPSHLSDAMHKLVYRKLNWGQGVRCEIDRNNASGESDTTFRNGMGNFVVKLIALRRTGRLTGPAGVAFVAAATRLGFVYEIAAIQVVYNDPLGDFCARVWLGRQLVLKPGRVFAKLCWTCSPNIPFRELRSAKLRAAVLDLRAFPEVSCELAKLTEHCGDVTSRGMAVVAAARYGVIGSSEASSLEERRLFFSNRYGVEYAEVVNDVAAWVRAAANGESFVELPALRRVAEFDMGVTSLAAVAATTERKLVCDATCMSLRSARARRLNEEAASARARPAWLSRMWSKLMHSLVGNGRSMAWRLVLGLVFWYSLTGSAGREGGWNLIPEQTLSYQRQRIAMPNNKGNKNKALQLPQGRGSKKNGSKKGPAKSQPNASMLKGGGMYKLLAPLAKMAVQAALPGALQNAGQRLFTPQAAGFRGSGDYVTNDIVHTGGGLAPKKGLAGVPVTKYTHTEYVTDILVPSSPAAFVSQKFNINAADSATFPWLSRLAALYTKHRFTKLLFEFRTTTSNYSSAGTLGTVVMAPHYNVDSVPFATKQMMEAATHAVSAAPSTSIIMGYECAKKDANVTWYNVLNDASVVRNNFTDPGYVEVATSGLPGTAGTTLGELWVHYTCELIEPYISAQEQVADATTVSRYVGFTGTTGVWTAGFLGMGLANNESKNEAQFPSANYRPSYVSTTTPSNDTWFTYTTGDGGAAPKTMGFREKGTYVLTLTARLSSAPSASSGPPWTLSAVSGAVTVVCGNTDAASTIIWPSTGTPWFSYRWVVTVSAGAVITSNASAGWTSQSTQTMPAYELIVSKIS